MTPKREVRLENLNARMHAKNTCALKQTVTNVVYGKGSLHASVMFVGEAPGKKEDETGEPFVGASGKLLTQMLASIDLTRDEVYITNIVKYRPPDNRDPYIKEIAACWPWLLAEIELIQPRLIVPLGRHALAQFLPDRKIKDAHGNLFVEDIHHLKDQNIFPLYHPAAALYNGSLREMLFSDFALIPRFLRDPGNEKNQTQR